jgi:hypothetical protein
MHCFMNTYTKYRSDIRLSDSYGVKEPLRRPVMIRVRVVAATDDSVWGCEGGFGCVWRPVFRPPDAVLPEHCQTFAMHIEVYQREVRAQPVMVLGQPLISDLVEAEEALQDAERMFHLRPHAGLTPVLLFL